MGGAFNLSRVFAERLAHSSNSEGLRRGVGGETEHPGQENKGEQRHESVGDKYVGWLKMWGFTRKLGFFDSWS